jgi:hypothetical protein
MFLICAKFDRRLQKLIDQRLDPAGDLRLARHAARCAHCRRSLDAHALLLAELGERAGLRPAERATALASRDAMARRISQRVFAQRQADPIHLVSAHARRRLIGATAAVLLLVTAWQAPRWNDTDAIVRDRRADGAARHDVTSVALPIAQTSISLQPPLSAPQIAMPAVLTTERKLASLAKETGEGLAAVTRWLPGLRPVRPAMLNRPGESLDPSGRSKADADPAWGALGDWIDLWPALPQDSRS